jgi:DNA-binding LytR/AlgR family response regulator
MEKYKVEKFDFTVQDGAFFYTTGCPKMKIYVADILYLTADGSYTTIFLKKERNIIVRTQLIEFDRLLSDSGFIRINKSILVNAKYITAIDIESEEKKCFVGEIGLKISRRRLKSLMKSNLFLPFITKFDR